MVKGKIVKEGNVCRKRIRNPNKCDKRSLRTLTPSQRTRIIICCPKGKWDARKKECKVSTITQSIVKKTKKDKTCPKF